MDKLRENVWRELELRIWLSEFIILVFATDLSRFW